MPLVSSLKPLLLTPFFLFSFSFLLLYLVEKPSFSYFVVLIGFCWLLPVGPWDDILVLSFSWRSGVCKYILPLFLSEWMNHELK